jgi:hypothetical protein
MFLALSGLPVEHPYPDAVSAAWGRLEALCEPHQAST